MKSMERAHIMGVFIANGHIPIPYPFDYLLHTQVDQLDDSPMIMRDLGTAGRGLHGTNVVRDCIIFFVIVFLNTSCWTLSHLLRNGSSYEME
jgi:hypothetical protein